MGIPLSSNFDLSAQLPLEAKSVQPTLVARDAIPPIERYEGLVVYVEEDQTNYQLQGGTDNVNWIIIEIAPAGNTTEIQFNSSGSFWASSDLRFGSPAGTLTLNHTLASDTGVALAIKSGSILRLSPGGGSNVIDLGSPNYPESLVALGANGTQADISVRISAKGSGTVRLGGSFEQKIILFGEVDVYGPLNFTSFGNSTIKGHSAFEAKPTPLSIIGGESTGLLNFDGADVLIYGGSPSGTGLYGDVYFGTGSAGRLKAKTTETNVVFYDETTGLLSYGLGGGGTGSSLWTESGSDIYYNSGNVGIGTTTPTASLEVRGAASTSLMKINSDSGNTGIQFLRGNVITGYVWSSTEGVFNVGPGSTSNSISFANDNVGIGTTTPARLLNIVKSGATSVMSIERTGTSTSALILAAHTSLVQILARTSDLSTTGVPIVFYMGSTAVMRIATTGNVGMGTSNTDYPLTVNGDIKLYNRSSTTGRALRFEIWDGTTNHGDLRMDARYRSGEPGIHKYWQAEGGSTGSNAWLEAWYNGTSYNYIKSNDLGIHFNCEVQSQATANSTLAMRWFKSDGTSLLGFIYQGSSGEGLLYLRDSTNTNTTVIRSQGTSELGGPLEVPYIGVGTAPNTTYGIYVPPARSYGIEAHGATMGGRFEDSSDTSRAYCAYGNYGFYTNLGTANYFLGNVGIGSGKTNPQYALDVNGNIFNSEGASYFHSGFSSGNNFIQGYNTSGVQQYIIRSYVVSGIQADFKVGAVSATNFILSSDIRLKNNIKPLNTSPVDITYKQFEMNSEVGQLRYGVIAQDLQLTNPELVKEDENGMLSVLYIDLLVKEVSYLKEEVKSLKNKLNEC